MSDAGTDFQNDGIGIGALPPDLSRVRIYEKTAVIWAPENTSNFFYFLRRGQICLVVHDERGHEVIVRIIRPGEPFGFACFAPKRGTLQQTTALAAVRSEVVEIPCDQFIEFTRQSACLTRAVLATAAERLAYSEERIRIMANHNAEDRLCALLDQLGRCHGRPSRGSAEYVRINFTHADLAQLSGLNRPHLSMIMGRLRERGIITYGRNKPLVVNTEALAKRKRTRSSKSNHDAFVA